VRIPSGVVDQVIYFVAVDATDLKTREAGLTNFTVWRSRNGAAATAMTTPTVTEVAGGGTPGVYSLLLDEDMTIGAGNDSEEMVFHITENAGAMAPVTRTIELYAPLLDLADGVESGVTLRQALRAIAAVLVGKASGGPGSSVFKGVSTSTTRVTSVSDTNGDRSSVTLNL